MQKNYHKVNLILKLGGSEFPYSLGVYADCSNSLKVSIV